MPAHSPSASPHTGDDQPYDVVLPNEIVFTPSNYNFDRASFPIGNSSSEATEISDKDIGHSPAVLHLGMVFTFEVVSLTTLKGSRILSVFFRPVWTNQSKSRSRGFESRVQKTVTFVAEYPFQPWCQSPTQRGASNGQK